MRPKIFIRRRSIYLWWILLVLAFSTSQNCMSEVVEKFSININSLSLPMATAHLRLEKTDSTQTIFANTSTRGILTALYKFNNQYISICHPSFLPIKYEKNIIQKDFQEKKTVIFNYKKLIALTTDLLNPTEIAPDSLPIKEHTYDLFSALFAIREAIPSDTCSFYCLANYNLWKVKAKFLNRETLNIHSQKKESLKYLIEFKLVTDSNIKSRTDILTNNLFKPKSHLIFWFSDDEKHIPLKAKYGRPPFSVYWYIKSY